MIWAHAQSRGWKIVWNGSKWIYEDDGTSINKQRPCIRCGKKPTPEGYDACLGKLPGVHSACCGHGIDEKFILYTER